jgi:hypothetical protein
MIRERIVKDNRLCNNNDVGADESVRVRVRSSLGWAGGIVCTGIKIGFVDEHLLAEVRQSLMEF